MTERTLTAKEFVAENPVGLRLVSREGQMHIRARVKACYVTDDRLVIEVTNVWTASFGPPLFKPLWWKRDTDFSYGAPKEQTIHRERKGKYRLYIMYIGGIVIGTWNTRELAGEPGLLSLLPMGLWGLWRQIRERFRGSSR